MVCEINFALRMMDRKSLDDFFPDEAAAEVGPDGPSGPRWADDVHRSGLPHRGPVGPTRTYFPAAPPCQAYSIIGRSRVGGIHPDDLRVHLDRESLRILTVHRPAVFVMENVRGILSDSRT